MIDNRQNRLKDKLVVLVYTVYLYTAQLHFLATSRKFPKKLHKISENYRILHFPSGGKIGSMKIEPRRYHDKVDPVRLLLGNFGAWQ